MHHIDEGPLQQLTTHNIATALRDRNPEHLLLNLFSRASSPPSAY